MTPYEAIFNRKSVRRFEQTPLPEDMLNKIKICTMKLENWKSNVKYQFRIISGADSSECMKGMFKVVAPHYLVLLVEDKKEAMFEAGVLAEYMVLYLTTKGIATCYQGGLRVTSLKIPNGYRLAMVIAFGYARGKLYRDSSLAKRQPLSKLCMSLETAGEDIRMLLKAARLAPSAFNRQPWRMVVSAEQVHLYVKKLPVSRGITASQLFDMGIMYCHMDQAADEQWFQIEKSKDSAVAKKFYKDLYYLATVSKIKQ